jgi:hypothetical protein
MRTHSKLTLFLAFMAAFVLFACNLPTADNSAQGDVMFTQAAETLAVYLTQTQQAILLTPQPSATSTAFFPTATATKTPDPTKTPVPEVQICDWAQYIKDVTVPDGTVFTPGAEFTKTWRIRNIGTCTWNSYYDLVFDDGDGMNGDASVPIDEVIKRKRNPISAGSFIGVRKRTKESAPSRPRPSGIEVCITRNIKVMEGPPIRKVRWTPAPMCLEP